MKPVLVITPGCREVARGAHSVSHPVMVHSWSSCPLWTQLCMLQSSTCMLHKLPHNFQLAANAPMRSQQDLDKFLERGTALRIRASATSWDFGFATIFCCWGKASLVEGRPCGCTFGRACSYGFRRTRLRSTFQNEQLLRWLAEVVTLRLHTLDLPRWTLLCAEPSSQPMAAIMIKLVLKTEFGP